MNKTVVITGASKGLGLSIAEKFLATNYKVFSLARTNSNNNNIVHLPTDITNIDSINESIKKIDQIDILINNAGIFKLSKFSDMNLDQIHNIIDVNLKGTINITKLLLPKLKSGSKIIFVNSVAGINKLEQQSIYCASKHGLTAFADILGNELRHANISVSSIFPGGLNTSLWNNDNPYPLGDVNQALDPNVVAELIFNIASMPHLAVLKNITVFPNIEWH